MFKKLSAFQSKIDARNCSSLADLPISKEEIPRKSLNYFEFTCNLFVNFNVGFLSLLVFFLFCKDKLITINPLRA